MITWNDWIIDKPGDSKWPFWDGENVTPSKVVGGLQLGDKKVTTWIPWKILFKMWFKLIGIISSNHWSSKMHLMNGVKDLWNVPQDRCQWAVEFPSKFRKKHAGEQNDRNPWWTAFCFPRGLEPLKDGPSPVDQRLSNSWSRTAFEQKLTASL